MYPEIVCEAKMQNLRNLPINLIQLSIINKQEVRQNGRGVSIDNQICAGHKWNVRTQTNVSRRHVHTREAIGVSLKTVNCHYKACNDVPSKCFIRFSSRIPKLPPDRSKTRCPASSAQRRRDRRDWSFSIQHRSSNVP